MTELLIKRTRKFYTNNNDFNLEIEGSVYALDSTVIELCLTNFKWAYFELGNSAKAFFIIRAKKSISWKRLYSHEIDRTSGLRCDQTIKLKNFYAKKYYPEKLRRIKYYDQKPIATMFT